MKFFHNVVVHISCTLSLTFVMVFNLDEQYIYIYINIIHASILDTSVNIGNGHIKGTLDVGLTFTLWSHCEYDSHKFCSNKFVRNNHCKLMYYFMV